MKFCGVCIVAPPLLSTVKDFKSNSNNKLSLISDIQFAGFQVASVRVAVEVIRGDDKGLAERGLCKIFHSILSGNLVFFFKIDRLIRLIEQNQWYIKFVQFKLC